MKRVICFFSYKLQWTVTIMPVACWTNNVILTQSYHIVCVCSPCSQQLGVCVLPEVKLPQRITQIFHLLTIDRIEPLLQYCSCSSKTMMNSVSNRVHHLYINRGTYVARCVCPSRQSRARRSRLASQGPRLAAGHAAKPRHVVAKPRAAKPRII